jgi:hypothetical protein
MPILGIMASQISGKLWAPAGAYDALATVTLSATTASVTFTGIPSGYKHLQIRALVQETDPGAGPGALWMQANGDTGSNYSWHRVWGDGASVFAGSGTSTTWSLVGINSRSGNGANVFGSTIIDVLDYANVSKYKTFRGLTGEEMNSTSGYIGLHSGLWMNNNAITSITLLPSSGYSWTAKTQFALFGVK